MLSFSLSPNTISGILFSIHITEAVISITPRCLSTTSVMDILSYFLAFGLILGSLSYTPSIAFSLHMASVSNSMQLSTLYSVSVEKYGMTCSTCKEYSNIPFLKYVLALSLEKVFCHTHTSNGVSISLKSL